jgi:hypothetical protein
MSTQSRWGSTIRFLVKWCGVALLSLLMCEASLRVWGFNASYTIQIKGLPVGQQELRLELDRHRLYRVKPWPSRSINSWGYRDREFGAKRADVFRIVVVGDSFPMGLAVQPKETFPKQLEQQLGEGYEVLNLGIQGYGTDQEFVVIQEDVLRLQPDLVIWSIFPGNDFGDVVNDHLYELTPDNSLHLVEDNYITTHVPKLRLGLAYNIFRYGSFLPPTVEKLIDGAFFQDKVHILVDPNEPNRLFGVPLAQKLITEGLALLKSNGIPVAFVIIPSFEIVQDDSRIKAEGVPPELYETNENLALNIVTSTSLPVVNLTPLFRSRASEGLYVASDRHLSVTGHHLAALELEALLRQSRLLPQSETGGVKPPPN